MEERKNFFEVFSELDLKKDIKELFQLVVVTKVAINQQKSSLRIYISSQRLISKQDIYQVENTIVEQLFPENNMAVKIVESFNLSKQYNAKKLYDVYKDSMMLEIGNYSKVLQTIFKVAKKEFTSDNVLRIEIAGGSLMGEKTDELKRIIEKVFNERCHVNLEVDMEFSECQESKFEKENVQRLRQELKVIMSNLPQEEPENESASTTEPKSENKTSLNSKTSNKSEGGRRQGKKFYNNSYQTMRAKDPNTFYGRDFLESDEAEIVISSIVAPMGEVIIKGQIISVDSRELKSGNKILLFAITDFTDSIMVKMFLKPEAFDEIEDDIKKGKFIRVKGVTTVDKYDGEITVGSVVTMKRINSFLSDREDTSLNKRVELHCHTKMSDMDGVSSAKDLIKRAMSFGHKALAITDHGVVQGFTDAFHAIQAIGWDYKKQEKELDFKLIYGVEAYLVDDLKDVVVNLKQQDFSSKFVVFDLETTGFSATANRIIEIGATKIENGKIVDKFETFVNPDVPIPFKIEQLTGIKDEMVLQAPKIEEILPSFIEFCEGSVLIAHNAEFDMSFIRANCKRIGIDKQFTYGDTVGMARMLLPALGRHTLNAVAKVLKISLQNHHRAVDDARCTAEIFMKFIEMYKERKVNNLEQINEMGKTSIDMVRKSRSNHAIIIATSEIGRVNLYNLISNSNLKYFYRTPRIPKSDFLAHREGLIIGSACEAGELYQAILNGRDEKEIARLVRFYDYLEIQPVGNNKFMIPSDKYDNINSEEDIRDINRTIVKLGEQFGKPVVATCDVHFKDPEDEVYRRIIMAGKGFKDADDQAPLYLHSTDEMLDEFEYLGSDKAYEVVVENTNKIADMCDKIEPVDPNKHAPVIENSDETLRNICYDKAHAIYGDTLPEVVSERLERELNSIISNGFAVMYIIAQKLVWKSNEDGYLVGSRGSVGSSFVATMSGITEVNPLRPHYYCKKCHYSDFDSDAVKEHLGGAGCDLPSMKCPECGEELMRDGFDIPFETFLGFYGDKEPDIDLNFSGEYQSKAHAYTEVIFGKGQTYRAGTIGTLADKTAFGYVKNYFEEREDRKRVCEINRMVQGCVGVRRTTGQHPGGIVVLPHGDDINQFTPVQHPANDMTTSIITTHFDYHSIEHNLLKLDILGHDDPTMIRMLEDLTGVDALGIPLDDQKVMSLFLNTSALGVLPEDLKGCKMGSLGVPEFGTEFVIQMLADTKPTKFADLVRISGLSHGTDVWLNNAQTLIQEGKATISTAICTRDDIMTYLINKGVEAGTSFNIMESVRKGKGLTSEWEDTMRENDVPEWYIWSCKKIKYMFPKAHAAAYVMMAFRVAYFKVYYPLAYYAAFFSIRATAFDYELMCQGKEKLEIFMNDYIKRNERKELTKKEEDTLKDMKVVQEMYARGYTFMQMDLYKSQSKRFQIIDNKLLPSFITIEGMGEKAAELLEEAAKSGEFLSKDDLKERGKVSKTVIETMSELGILGKMTETNQISLFDGGFV